MKMTSLDTSQLTFLERIARSAREPTYSAAVAWLLDDQSPLPLQERVSIVERFTGRAFPSVMGIEAETERDNIDILLTLRSSKESAYVAIENKIKATDSKLQLAKYDASLRHFDGQVTKIFLSVAGENPRSGDSWSTRSYSQLADAIHSQAHSNSPYVSDTCLAIQRLATVAEAAVTDTNLAGSAFGDRGVGTSPFLEYVKSLKLEKMVQRIWMSALLSRLSIPSPWEKLIDETNVQALLDVRAHLVKDPGFLVGVQFQGRAIKINAVPYPYPKVATLDQHNTVTDKLELFRTRLSLPVERRDSTRRARGFRSITVDTMPEGRELDSWVVLASLWIDRLVDIMGNDVEAVPLALVEE